MEPDKNSSGTSVPAAENGASVSTPVPVVAAAAAALITPPGITTPKAKTRRIDMERFRLDQNFHHGATNITRGNIPIRKPDPQNWFMVHPEWEYPVKVLEFKGAGATETFLIDPDLQDEFFKDLKSKVIVPCITRQADIFVWPVNLPDITRENSWTRSALKAVNLAKEGWIRITANMGTGGYDVRHPTIKLNAATWSEDVSLQDLIDQAFEHFIIDDVDHPRLRALRGE